MTTNREWSRASKSNGNALPGDPYHCIAWNSLRSPSVRGESPSGEKRARCAHSILVQQSRPNATWRITHRQTKIESGVSARQAVVLCVLSAPSSLPSMGSGNADNGRAINAGLRKSTCAPCRPRDRKTLLYARSSSVHSKDPRNRRSSRNCRCSTDGRNAKEHRRTRCCC